MAKQPQWTIKEREKLFQLLDERKPYQEIAKKLNRSVNGIKLKISRFGYNPKCLGCGETIFNRKGNRLRCKFCAMKHNKIEKRKYMKSEKMKIYLKAKRDKDRFGKLREVVIKRDGEKCVNCGMTRQEHFLKFGCDITVNHKDGTGRNSKEHNNKKENLETLCLVCHGKKDVVRRRKDWSMCAKFLIKYQKSRPKIIKYKCAKCGKCIKNNKERYKKFGNFCDKCGG